MASSLFPQNNNMMNLMKNASNPQAMLQNMVRNHPQYQNVMNIITQYGGDPQRAFYEVAKQKGVNPEDILRMIKGL